MIRNIIFDWSGTLVDDLPAVWQATNHVFRRSGLEEITLPAFRAEFCLPFKSFYEKYTPHVPPAQLEEWFHGHFKEAQAAVTELPHARDFLEFCRATKTRTFVLSAVHDQHFTTQAQVTGFAPFIDRAYVGIMDKRAKIKALLEENRLEPSETLFIGDMQHDIETAQHGGVHSCAVLTGYNSLDQLRAADPDLIVENLAELQHILERNQMSLESPLESASISIPIVTVGAAIFDHANNVLMIRTHKWSNLWGIPGGKTKFGETSTEALKREIKEETDLEVTDVRFIMVQDCIRSTEFYRDAHFVLLNYMCRCAGEPRVRLNDEAEEFRWTSLTEALTMPLNQPTRILLNEIQLQKRG